MFYGSSSSCQIIGVEKRGKFLISDLKFKSSSTGKYLNIEEMTDYEDIIENF